MLKNKVKFLVIAFLLAVSPNFVFAETLEEVQKELENIKEAQIQVKEQYDDIENDMSIYQKEIDELESQLLNYTLKIGELEGKVSSTTKDVEELEKKLQQVSNDYESTRDLLNTRLRALYENGFVNMWEILFTSTNMMDFLSKYNVIIELIQYDKTMLSAMENQKEYISNLKNTAELKKTQVDQAKYDLERTKETLELLKSNKQSKVDELEATKNRLDVKKAELDKLSLKIEEKYNALRAEAGLSGDFIWPLRSYGYITSYYGYYRPELGQFYGHRGVDMVSTGDIPYNKYYTGGYVRASASGTVVSMFKETPRDQGNSNSRCPDTAQGPGYSCGGSTYGRYVKIYNYTTGYSIIYGHLYEIADNIQVGSFIAQGTIIGVMGTTGSSTGTHLHFEVRDSSNSTVDPLLIKNIIDSRNLQR